MDPTVLARLALLSAVLAISSPAAPTSTTADPSIYVVQAGDTLYSIALKFGLTLQELEQANNLTDSTPLTVGLQLHIPAKTTQTAGATPSTAPTSEIAGVTPTSGAPPNTQTYTVQAGDTLAAIAARFNLTVDDLAQANGIKNIDLLQVGQVLKIPKPGATSPNPSPASPLPTGVTLIPSTVKQGNTLEIRITATDTVTATGTFAGTSLQFISESGKLYALAGISRCANVGTYPVALSTTSSDGRTTPFSFSIQVNKTNYPVEDITLTPQMAALLDPALEQAENTRVAHIVSTFLPARMWNGPFQSPLAIKNPRVSAPFGQRRSYNGGAVGACGHEGQDFAVDGGTPVYAPAAGVVALAEPLKVRGNVVFIDHGLGVYSGFYHLSKIIARQGQRVKPGDLVGLVGTTGFSTGNHLHWSLWVNGVYVDPIEWTNRTIP